MEFLAVASADDSVKAPVERNGSNMVQYNLRATNLTLLGLSIVVKLGRQA